MHEQADTADSEQMRGGFISEPAGSCAGAELQNWALTIFTHFDLQFAHFGDRRKLNPIGSITGTLFHSAFFLKFRVISKLCVKEALWLICRFCLFGTSPAGSGENIRSQRHWNGCYACRGSMNVCMWWDFDTGKHSLDTELTHKSLYDMVILLFTGYLFLPTESLAPLKSFATFWC